MIARFAIPAAVATATVGAGEPPMASNSEMAAIYAADQADRVARPIDWRFVGPADARRRAQTKRHLDAGLLRTGGDFYDAAFVYQHGDTPSDFLKAHLLAMAAMAKGQPDEP